MITTVYPSPLKGELNAIPSKSHTHRLLICAALSEGITEIICPSSSEDIDATASCLDSLGAKLIRTDRGFRVHGIGEKFNSEKGSVFGSPSSFNNPVSSDNVTFSGNLTSPLLLDCGESGSTYRFLLPAACAVLTLINRDCEKHNEIRFRLHGRLPKRPMSSLFSVLESHGIHIEGKGTDTVSVSGRLSGGIFSVPGNVSSQYISGLLFALSILNEESRIEISGNIESEGYIDMTVNTLRQFGADVEKDKNILTVKSTSRLTSPGIAAAEGDWSNSAFWLSAAAVSGNLPGSKSGSSSDEFSARTSARIPGYLSGSDPDSIADSLPGGKSGNSPDDESGNDSFCTIKCPGLNPDSLQRDKEICNILKKMGAEVIVSEDTVSVSGHLLRGIELDVSQIPDLVPAIAAAAVFASGRTVIYGGERLRMKESDRLASVSDVLEKLGADISQTPNGLEIQGKKELDGGTVDSWGDHRIAMMAAIVSIRCRNPVIIKNAQAVNKSYPDFWKDFRSLGGTVVEENI